LEDGRESNTDHFYRKSREPFLFRTGDSARKTDEEDGTKHD